MLGLRGGGGGNRTAYLARVSGVCATYARRLSRIGAPSDVTAYGDVVATAGAALRILRAQLAAMQAVPGGDTAMRRLYALDRSSIAALEATLTSARRRDAAGVARGLARFSAERDRTHAVAVLLGVDCSASGGAAA